MNVRNCRRSRRREAQEHDGGPGEEGRDQASEGAVRTRRDARRGGGPLLREQGLALRGHQQGRQAAKSRPPDQPCAEHRGPPKPADLVAEDR